MIEEEGKPGPPREVFGFVRIVDLFASVHSQRDGCAGYESLVEVVICKIYEYGHGKINDHRRRYE